MSRVRSQLRFLDHIHDISPIEVLRNTGRCLGLATLLPTTLFHLPVKKPTACVPAGAPLVEVTRGWHQTDPRASALKLLE